MNVYIGISIFEEKLTNDQLEYLRECKYTSSIFYASQYVISKTRLQNEQSSWTKRNLSNLKTMEY